MTRLEMFGYIVTCLIVGVVTLSPRKAARTIGVEWKKAAR